MTFTGEDHAYMARALALTARGRDTASPNPSVGCVIARAGKVLGEGWHERAGEAHAEVRAIAAAKESVEGATAYVTLEPCNHHGRTPPCVDALLAAKIGRVVAAMEDPNPLVKGKGAQRLRDAGVQVDVGLMQSEATEAHRGFVTRMTLGRPWMRIKSAASLDGRIALANGESQWITGEIARRDVHVLRARSCAMLTGIGTVLRDDPQLTVRHVPATRQPKRVLIDSRLDVPLEAKILQGEPPLIFTVSTDADKRKRIEATGAEVVTAPIDPKKPGKTDLVAIAQELGKRGFNEVTVETGAKLNGSLVAAGVIDELVLYFAPLVLGTGAQGLFDFPDLTSLSDAKRLRILDVRFVGEDLRLTARFGS
ncbi:bifunctional diaminohydroxyphosphoribosylaminopyrimidine deaminase/5-amino-6-(5-phosphoribosylamino)uracil reductase RibD [Usitatibacter palustris]|uniref:Riboflavin biosynthesis protein RibD n=1 Tax=Usitatibacter palustris TaxID=2732487 RepID=A0A6M4H5F7_9PROT|nr:bifunctional diaminohydroxyphosphoribosylaminopyrimidine deaminase/5-amino-6-(5-phosphoribosylamino)uracil reductase RibD [Usitatibacter palustris]QJR14720.1 Riboflavin biosynthesis protein RibD [Usitatibacter palustris]